MEWKKDNMKKHHDILYNRINIEAERIEYEQEIRGNFRETLQRENKVAELNRMKAEAINTLTEQRTREYKEYRD